jgi:hypothetical protein
LFSAGHRGYAALLLFMLATAPAAQAAPAAKPAGKPKAETHAFSGIHGEIIDAEVLAVEDVDVIVKRTDGKTFTLDLPTLSRADQTFVQKWKATGSRPNARSASTESDIAIAVSLEPAATGDKNSAPGAFIPKVTLRNRENQGEYKDLKGTLILIGQSTNNPWRFKVLAVEKFTGSVAAGAKLDFTGKACVDLPPQGGQPGYRYRGYFVVLQNAEDNLIQMLHSGPFVKTGAEVLKLQPGALFATRPPSGAIRARAGANNAGHNNWQSMTSVLPLQLNQTVPATTPAK